MGVAVATAARDLGAEVTLLHGPMLPAVPAGIEGVAVENAAEMEQALVRLAPDADVAFLAAAVADFRPREVERGKLNRREGSSAIDLEPVPDLAAGVGAMPGRPYLVVFSAEDGPQKERAVAKMQAKKADAVVLNDVSSQGVGMEAADNEVWVMTASGIERHVPRAAKSVIGREIILALAGEVLASRAGSAGG
jgi:phosphopantothenoylcysteine decarboxylase/phosphopantothenate--cysteine ligase